MGVGSSTTWAVDCTQGVRLGSEHLHSLSHQFWRSFLRFILWLGPCEILDNVLWKLQASKRLPLTPTPICVCGVEVPMEVRS